MIYASIPVDNIEYEQRPTINPRSGVHARIPTDRPIATSQPNALITQSATLAATIMLALVPMGCATSASREVVSPSPLSGKSSLSDAKNQEAAESTSFEVLLRRARVDLQSAGHRETSRDDAEFVALSKKALAVFDSQKARSVEEWSMGLADSMDDFDGEA